MNETRADAAEIRSPHTILGDGASSPYPSAPTLSSLGLEETASMRAPRTPVAFTLGAVVTVVAAVVVALGAYTAVSLRAHRNDPDAPLHGVQLGMGPADVRTRFVEPANGGRGEWRSSASDAPGEVRLAWQPEASRANVTTFDFHDGLLVAASLFVPSGDPDAQGPRVVVSSATVLARRGASDAFVELRLLARDCPTHAAEVHRLLADR